MQAKHLNTYIISIIFFFIIAGMAEAAPLNITTTSPLPNGTQYTAYSFPLTYSVSGGSTTPPYTWALTAGSLPSNLSLNPGTGIISGTPNVAGTFNFSVQLSDSGTPKQKSDTATFSLTIATATTCSFVGTTSGSVLFGNIDPSLAGPVSNTSVSQVLFRCNSTLSYSFATIPVTPSLTFGANSIPFTLGLAAPGQNVTDTTQISLLTMASSVSKPNYQNAAGGPYSTVTPIQVTISWGGPTPGSITANVTASGTVLNTCIYSAPGALTFNIDPSVSGTTSATISSDLLIRCTYGDNSVTISASSLNGGPSPKMNCTSPSCGGFQIPYTFRILNSNAWPISAPQGTGFGGAGTPLNISGSVSSTDYANAPIGTYADIETVTISY